MNVDLHSHFPMHIDPVARAGTLRVMTAPRRREEDAIRALILDFACRIANYRSLDSGPAVTVKSLRAGRVGVALSVLYCPFAEMDLDQPYGAPPQPEYFTQLVALLDSVEREIATHHAQEAGIARSVAELDALLQAGKLALVHAVEGGFHFGATPREIAANVKTLAGRGLAYITVAHLFYRGIARNAPALPFLADPIYKLLFHESGPGLTDLGRALIEAMIETHVLIDVTHMDESSLGETFGLLDGVDPAKTIPVIASHMACRFGDLEYNLTDPWLEKIAERKGVIGVILCDHYTTNGIRQQTRTLEESLEVVARHVDRIRSVTGSHDHTALGTDLDGFIKPTLAGLDDASHLWRLEEAVVARYGAMDGAKICSENALRVLRSYWGGAGGQP
jgi:microsomal dipeptidase-like Zn-dependent dipeptidase